MKAFPLLRTDTGFEPLTKLTRLVVDGASHVSSDFIQRIMTRS